MPVPSPAIAVIDMPWLRAEIGAAKAVAGRPAPCRRCRPRPRRRPIWLTPLTASAACFGGARQSLRARDARQIADRSGRDRGNRAPAGSRRRGRQICPRARPSPSPPRARRARRCRRRTMSLVETTAWRLPTSTRRPRSSPSARSRFLDRAVAHLDRERHRAHRHRVGGVGAGGARGLDQPLGALGQRGLVEQGGGGASMAHSDPRCSRWRLETRAASTAIPNNLRGARQRLVNHGSQRAVNHAAQRRRGNAG